MSFSFLVVFYVIFGVNRATTIIFWKLASSSFLVMFYVTLCVVNETTIVSLKLTTSSFFRCVLYFMPLCFSHSIVQGLCFFSPSFCFFCFLNFKMFLCSFGKVSL